MDLKEMFKKTSVRRTAVGRSADGGNKPEAPQGLLKKCNKCGKGIFTDEYQRNLYL